MNTKPTCVSVERGLATNFGSNARSSFEHQFISQSWNTFQRLRQSQPNKNHERLVVTRGEGNDKVRYLSKPATGRETFKVSLLARNDSSERSNPVYLKPTTEIKPSYRPVKNDRRWARSWANHRARQAVLSRNESTFERSKSCETRSTTKTENMNPPRRSKSTRNITLDAKAAETFRRLRSIYINEEARDRRLQSIRERMNEFQQKSIKKEVNKSIQEFNRRLKEDEQNRKELRRVREKFQETKKQRLKHMHVSRNALDVPAVSRLAYGLPKEGKEFSVAFSSKKTTDEIKKLWRMAIVRQQCIDSFISKVSHSQQELPGVTVKPRLRAPSLTTTESSLRPENLHVNQPRKDHLKEIQEDPRRMVKPSINELAKLQTGILDTFDSLSSEEDDNER
ncbi:uncharacterized protein LOC114515798 [Dendronephthya gigantea]|uniref:uncharacterized protein LOC114515798 n=1 Tax=Dendronephthya gigantea TaxID=151771 RepID=UPI00106942AF|nr:uncharacterized protein LOC114515798 [Dendronephthya gigantea]